MVRVELITEIKRPLDEVFGYAADPSNLPEWNSIVEESVASEMPLRVGAKITGKARFLGRRFEIVSEVTEYVHNQKIVQKGDKPFPTTITLLFEPVGEGTRFTTIGEFEPGGFFKIGEPILARITHKQFQAQQETLKELLEARVPAEVS
jgi:uncharacterized protein YndB with AHSA1/START domain